MVARGILSHMETLEVDSSGAPRLYVISDKDVK